MSSNNSGYENVFVQAFIEYGLLLALIAVLVVIAMAPLGIQIHHVFQTIQDAHSQAALHHG